MEVVKILSDGTVEIPTEAKRMEQAKDMDVFWKIGDNTQYIIHPDEIAADNFMLALIAANENNFSKFSKTGRIKVESVLKLLKSKNWRLSHLSNKPVVLFLSDFSQCRCHLGFGTPDFNPTLVVESLSALYTSYPNCSNFVVILWICLDFLKEPVMIT